MTMYNFKLTTKKNIQGTIIVATNANANHIAAAINDAVGANVATPNNVILTHVMDLNAFVEYDAGDFGTYEGVSEIEE